MLKHISRKEDQKTKLKAFAGLTLAMFLVITMFYGFPVKSQEPIIIGVINPHGWPQGASIWGAAVMARDEINAAGGILGHQIELIDIDEHSVDMRPELAIEETVAAMEAGAQFLVGGFRSEIAFPVREEVMDYAATYGRPIWFVTGAATDELIDCGGGLLACGSCVRCDYERYKYIFRNTPMNSTCVGAHIFYYIRYHVIPILVGLYGSPVKTYLVCEDLVSWDKPYMAVAGRDYVPTMDIIGIPIDNYYLTPPEDLPPTAEGMGERCLLGPDADMVAVTRPSQFAEDFSAELAAIEASGARLIINFFSATAGVSWSSQYGELKTNAVVIGVNVEGQQQAFWDTTGGGCEYEGFINSMGTATPIVPGVTDKFWSDYYDRWGSFPIYTGFAAYDSMISLKETIEAAGTWPMTSDELIPLIEPEHRLGILGQFKYTGPEGIYHDVWVSRTCVTPNSYGDPPFVRGLMVQWQGGRQEAIWPSDQDWSKDYAIPPWMYADLVQDPGDDPPFADVTYDGAVDIFDIVTVAKAFGSKANPPLENPDPNWNIKADLKVSGEVDIFDIVTAAKDFGENISDQLPLP